MLLPATSTQPKTAATQVAVTSTIAVEARQAPSPPAEPPVEEPALPAAAPAELPVEEPLAEEPAVLAATPAEAPAPAQERHPQEPSVAEAAEGPLASTGPVALPADLRVPVPRRKPTRRETRRAANGPPAAVRRFGDTLQGIPVSSYAADGTRRNITIRPRSVQDVYYYSARRNESGWR
jgi:hypothetical protein